MIRHYLAEFSISYKAWYRRHSSRQRLKRRTLKKFSFRGVDLGALLDMSTNELIKPFSARALRRFKERTFKKFSFRGVDLDMLLDMSTDKLVKLFSGRACRRFQCGLSHKPMLVIKKLRKAEQEAPPSEKPEPVRTLLCNMIIVPEMIGSIVGVYNAKTFNKVEIKPEMIGYNLSAFSILSTKGRV